MDPIGLPGLDFWLTNPDPEHIEPDEDEPEDFNERYYGRRDEL